MDPNTYCSNALTKRQQADARPLSAEQAQLHLLLMHFAQFAPLDGTSFRRELAQMADAAERQGRRWLAAAAREVLAAWGQRTGR